MSRSIGYDVVTNRPKVAAYRAPGAPMSSFAVESAMDDLARKLGMDPIALREKNGARDGTKTHYGPTYRNIGFLETLEAAKKQPALEDRRWARKRRAAASPAASGSTSAANPPAPCHINEDGTVSGRLRQPGYRRLARLDGHDGRRGAGRAGREGAPDRRRHRLDRLHPCHRRQPRHLRHRHGGHAGRRAAWSSSSRTAPRRSGRSRAEAVDWQDGKAYPAGSNAGAFEPLRLAEIALRAGKTGGPISAEVSLNAQGAGPGFGAHICDVEVDRETGQVTILRYTAVQDVGKAIHPSYVEGQIQGGAAQGIGWALNEEYIYNAKGQMENPGFLDYRCPVASDLPMIEAVMVEVPNPRHPFGAKGVGEVPIVPPMAAVGNAIRDAIGMRMPDLPMSPPKVRAALDAKAAELPSDHDTSPASRERSPRAAWRVRVTRNIPDKSRAGGFPQTEASATRHFLRHRGRPLHRRPHRNRSVRHHLPPSGEGTRRTFPWPWQSGRGRHGCRDRWRHLSGRLRRPLAEGAEIYLIPKIAGG